MKWPANVYIFNLGDAVFLLENMPTEALQGDISLLRVEKLLCHTFLQGLPQFPYLYIIAWLAT